MIELAGWLVALVVAGALGWALAGRGRGGGASPPPPGPDPETLDDDELREELQRAAEELRRRGL